MKRPPGLKIGKQTLRIVGKKPEFRVIGSGALRRDILGILDLDLAVEMDDLPPWLDDLINLLEERYTPRRPSIRDQIHFMGALAALVSNTPPPNAPSSVSEAMVYLGDPLGLFFDPEPKLKFWPDSPDAGDDLCICSYCEEVIDAAPVTRFFDRGNKTEARLHLECIEVCRQFNLIPENTSGL